MIPDKNPYNNWSGNGSTTTFDFDFYIEDETQLAVYHTNSKGVQTLLKFGTDYSINELKNENGSFINFPVNGSSYDVLGEDEVISLCLTLPIAQENPYGKSSYLDLETLEYSLDYLTRICQIISRQMERSVKTQEGSSQSADELIEALQEAQVNAAASASDAASSASAANASAISAGEEATIATQQAAIVEETYNTAMNDIAASRQTAINDIETSQAVAVSEIASGRENIASDLNSALSSMNTEKVNVINNIKATGIFMEDDRLFYYDNTGVKHEFRNDFGGIAPMAVKHKSIQKVENGFALTWTDPDDSIYENNVYCNWESTLIIRKIGSYPESPFDGDRILISNIHNQYSETPFIDEVDTSIDYKYRAFPRSINKVYSQDVKNKFGVWVYAFEENDLEANPAKRITYLEDNKYFKENYMNFTSGEFAYNDWEGSPFYHWDYIRPCMLYNTDAVDAEGNNLCGKVMEYLNPDDYSLTIEGNPSHYADKTCNANAMVEKRKIFLKIEIVDENKTRYYFSNEKLDEGYECYPCLREDGTYNEFYYTPMFSGALVNNKIMSLGGGLAAISSKTAQDEINYARANGNGYDTEVWSDIVYEELIFRLTFKNTDAQAVLGVGVTNSSNALSSSGVSGRAYNKGANYGTTGTDFPVKFRHRENFYAYQWQRFRGLIYINGIPYVKMTKHTGDGSTATDYNITGDGYIKLAEVPVASGTSGGYISKTKATQFGTFSTVVSGSSSTYLCDGRWFNNSGTMYPYRGGDSNAGSLCGAFALASGGAASGTYWGIGAALSYKPL